MNNIDKNYLAGLRQNIEDARNLECKIGDQYHEKSQIRIATEENYNSYLSLLCESILPKLIKNNEEFEEYKLFINEAELRIVKHIDAPKEYPCLVHSFHKSEGYDRHSYHHRFIYLNDAKKLLSSIT